MFFFFSVEHFTLIPYRQCKNNITQLEAILSNRYESNSSLNLCINTWTFWTKISCKELRVLYLMKEKRDLCLGYSMPYRIQIIQRMGDNRWKKEILADNVTTQKNCPKRNWSLPIYNAMISDISLFSPEIATSWIFLDKH